MSITLHVSKMSRITSNPPANFAIFFDFGKNTNYFCGREWLYGTYYDRFWGFMVGCEDVGMGQVFPLG